MLTDFFSAILYISIGFPLAVAAIEVARNKRPPRFWVLTGSFMLLVAAQVLFTVVGEATYFLYVILGAFSMCAMSMALTGYSWRARKKYPVDTTIYIFCLAILVISIGVYLANITTLGFYLQDLAGSVQNLTLGLAAVVLFFVGSACSILCYRAFGEEGTPHIAALFLWVLHCFGFTDPAAAGNRFFTAVFFLVIGVRVITLAMRQHKVHVREHKLLIRTRDVVSEMLHELSTSVKDLSAIDDMLKTVLDTTARTIQVDGAAVYLQSSKSTDSAPLFSFSQAIGSFWPVSAESDIVFTKRKYADYALENSVYEPGAGVVGIVAERCLPVVMDMSTDRERMTELGINGRVIRNVLAVPLQIKDQVLGVLIVENRTDDTTFDANDIHLLQSLADQAAVSVNNIRIYAELAETEKVRQEMHIASRIQQQLVPKEVPHVENLGISPFMQPAREVGGDYYDFLPYDEQRLAVVIGDVSGKGLPAGMIMIMAHTALHIVARHVGETRDIVNAFSKEMYSRIQLGHFMTMNFLLWFGDQRRMVYSGAGHEHILWYHKSSNKVERIKAGGMAVGLLEDTTDYIKQEELQMEQGDVAVLYTDGITEAKSDEKGMFSLDKLQDSVLRHAHLQDETKIQESIMIDVFGFMGDYEQYDDITLLVLHVK